MAVCKQCQSILNDDNWKQYNLKKRYYICNDCFKQYCSKKYKPKPKVQSIKVKKEIDKKQKSFLNKIYREKNLDKIKLRKSEYYQGNKQSITLKLREKRKNNPEKYKQYDRDRYRQHRKTIPLKVNKRKLNLLYKIRMSISSGIRYGLERAGLKKNNKSSWKHLDYSPSELKNHIEQLFEPWMTWSNWGVYRIDIWDDNDQSTWTWQIDHIIPHHTFKYSSMDDDEFKKCWSLNNLRPLSAKQNNMSNKFRSKEEIIEAQNKINTRRYKNG